MVRPTSKSPAVSQVQSVEVCERSSGDSLRSLTNAVSAMANESRTEAVVR